MGFTSSVQFHGADFAKLCGRSSNLWDHRIDSHLCFANRLNGADIVSKVGGRLTLNTGVTGNFYSNLLLRKLLCQGNDSVGAGCEGDIPGYDRNSLEELWDRLHNAIKELKAVRFRNTTIQKIVNKSIALQDKASSASNDLNQTPDVVQETIDEVCIAREAVQKATLALSLAETRLQVLMDSQEAAGYDASEVEDEVLETMIWSERAADLEREATQDVKEAEVDFQRTLKSHFDSQIQKTIQGQLLDGNTTVRNVSDIVDGVSSETSLEELWDRLHNAIKELKAVRFRNTMVQKIVNESIALQDKASSASNDLNQTPDVVQETIDEVCIAREAVQKATLALSLAETRLQVLMDSQEAAGYDASEVEDEVLETMIWCERAVDLEREATQAVKEAEVDFQRALKSHIDFQAQG